MQALHPMHPTSGTSQILTFRTWLCKWPWKWLYPMELDIEVDAPFFMVIQTLEIPLGSATWGQKNLDVDDQLIFNIQGSEKEFLELYFAEAWSGIHKYSNFVESILRELLGHSV